MSILLIGYRGSGKTTLGRALAERVGWPFIDQDQLITERAGLSIREIFQQHGEPHFRELESQHLLESLKLKNHVISLGGGAILAEQNRRAIAAAGHPVIYLRADAEELHRRIQADLATATQRPGLTHLGGNIEEIRQLLALREPIYQSVKTIEVNVGGRSISELVGVLQRTLASRPWPSNALMKLLIQNYLAAHSLAELESAYAIPAKRHREFPNLVMLKYSQINSPMNEPIVQQCRGIILDEDNVWAAVSYPFDKFFNYGEPNAAAIDWPHAKVYEKLDGSLMTLYWYRDQWRVASSGTPDAGGWAHESGITFAQLFWRTWQSMQYALPKDTSRCYMFELMTPENRVIMQHATSRLVLIGVRDLLNFDEHDPAPVAVENSWQAVAAYPLATLEDCVTAASRLTGLNGEGFVVRDAGFRRIKVKSPQYVALSHMKDTLSPRSMLEVIRKNESDEFLNYFPEIRPVYESVKAKYDQLCEDLEAEYSASKQIESQKDFALAIKTSRCPSALFALRNKKAATLREYFAAATQPSVERALGLVTEDSGNPTDGPAK